MNLRALVPAETSLLASALCAAAALGLMLPAPVQASQTQGGNLGQAVSAIFSGGRKKVITTLDGDHLATFNRLKVRKKSFSPMQYRAWQSCTYSYVSKRSTGEVFNDIFTNASTPVRDRFLVTMKHSKGTSTALIGTNGAVFDYNTTNIEDGTRITRENYAKVAAEILARENKRDPGSAGSRRIIDTTAINFPSFASSSLKPGQVAASVIQADGSVYLDFVYAGTLEYKNRKAVLLEMLANRDGKYSGGPMLVGFSILQQDNMMPLQTVFSIGNSYSQELLQCF